MAIATTKSSKPRQTPKRHCIHCGRRESTTVIFRDDFAMKCEKCDAETQVYRQAYQKLYHQARAAAMAKVIKKHRDDFEAALATEKKRVGL